MAYRRNELVSREIRNPHAENRDVWISATGISTRALPHPHHSVDFPALLHQQPLRGDVAVHHAGGLDLHTLIGADAAAHLAADDRLTRDHVAFHFPTLPDQHLAAGPHCAYHRAFDLHDALGGDVADDPHAGPDDGQPRF